MYLHYWVSGGLNKNRVAEVDVLSCIMWTTSCFVTKQLRIVGLLRRLHVTPPPHCAEGIWADKSKRKPASRSQGDSVYKFTSGHISTAGSAGALVQLSTATAGKLKKGPSSMSSNGRTARPIPVSEIYDDVYLKWSLGLIMNLMQLTQLEMKTSFRDCSKSPEL